MLLPYFCSSQSCCKSASCASQVASSAPAASRTAPFTQQRMPRMRSICHSIHAALIAGA